MQVNATEVMDRGDQARGVKRTADDSFDDDQRFAKRFNLLNLGMSPSVCLLSPQWLPNCCRRLSQTAPTFQTPRQTGTTRSQPANGSRLLTAGNCYSAIPMAPHKKRQLLYTSHESSGGRPHARLRSRLRAQRRRPRLRRARNQACDDDDDVEILAGLAHLY